MIGSGGGVATALGIEFQNRVAAWLAVNILAEKNIVLPLNLPEGTTLEWLQCETDQPVDDIIVGTSRNGLIFGQIKRTLSLRYGADTFGHPCALASLNPVY